MCGRFIITSPPAALRQMFGYGEQPNFPPRHNVAPTQPVPVVIIENGARHFRLMRWGLWPAWVKDPAKFTLLINARAETIREKPAFKHAITRRRCLVPADGYYEWHGPEKMKRPYFIQRRDGGPFALAGVAETWVGPNGEEIDTVALVTAAAGSDLAVLHHRVPVSIEPGNFERWLDCLRHSADDMMPLLTAAPPGEFVWHPVSSRVNRVIHDDAALIRPVTAEEIATEEADKTKTLKKPAPITGDDAQGSLF